MLNLTISIFFLSHQIAADAPAPQELKEPPNLAYLFWTELSKTEGLLPVKFALDALQGTLVLSHSSEGGLLSDFIEEYETLLVKQDAYFYQGSIKPILNLPVDSTAHLFEALFHAYYYRKMQSQEGIEADLREKAHAIYTDLPEGYRLSAYLNAISQMVGEHFSIAASFHRSFLKSGKALCDLFHLPLFKKWDTLLEEGQYYGAHFARSESGGDWVESRINLPLEDKQWVRDTLLQKSWVGDAREDFGRLYCQNATGE
jgi:hypothetical protein